MGRSGDGENREKTPYPLSSLTPEAMIRVLKAVEEVNGYRSNTWRRGNHVQMGNGD
jgi:hypothetical protein